MPPTVAAVGPARKGDEGGRCHELWRRGQPLDGGRLLVADSISHRISSSCWRPRDERRRQRRGSQKHEDGDDLQAHRLQPVGAGEDHAGHRAWRSRRRRSLQLVSGPRFGRRACRRRRSGRMGGPSRAVQHRAPKRAPDRAHTPGTQVRGSPVHTVSGLHEIDSGA